MRIVVLASAILMLAGCASITRGSTDAFVIETNPVGASATLSNGMSCTTPCSLKIKRKSEFVVKLEKEGYKTVEANITNKVAGGGAAGMAGNVLLGGFIGAAVDAGSGAMLDLVPNPLIVEMEPGTGMAPPIVSSDDESSGDDSSESETES